MRPIVPVAVAAVGVATLLFVRRSRAAAPKVTVPATPAGVPGGVPTPPGTPSAKRKAGGILLKRGMSGPLVAQWQTMIGEPSTGTFGANTEFMTKEFQKSHGLTVDGIVGPATWKAAGG